MAKASCDVVAARGAVDISGAAFFGDVWPQHSYPAINTEFEALRLMPASRMTAKHEKEHRDKKDTKGKKEHKEHPEHKEHKDDADIIQHKMVAVLDEARVTKER